MHCVSTGVSFCFVETGLRPVSTGVFFNADVPHFESVAHLFLNNTVCKIQSLAGLFAFILVFEL